MLTASRIFRGKMKRHLLQFGDRNPVILMYGGQGEQMRSPEAAGQPRRINNYMIDPWPVRSQPELHVYNLPNVLSSFLPLLLVRLRRCIFAQTAATESIRSFPIIK